MESNDKEKELSLALNQFLKIIYVDFGISELNDKIQRWYELSWDEFKRELENQSVKFNECLYNDWKEFFHSHKAKVNDLLQNKTIA
jgi:hypothetical protein